MKRVILREVMRELTDVIVAARIEREEAEKRQREQEGWDKMKPTEKGRILTKERVRAEADLYPRKIELYRAFWEAVDHRGRRKEAKEEEREQPARRRGGRAMERAIIGGDGNGSNN